MQRLCGLAGLNSSFGVDCIGNGRDRAGGLAILWNNSVVDVEVTVTTLPRYNSDHNLILLDCSKFQRSGSKKKEKLYRFEQVWLESPECREVVEDFWFGGRSIQEKIASVSQGLVVWGKKAIWGNSKASQTGSGSLTIASTESPNCRSY
ncbi:hypothetical protein RIF29_22381 [Crotalaria pallida]|uniref:Uncharacterized protein n=1 Tax=Crotalaria pallida TaxID=3830 RepID=A0AAN9I802_CROPI